MTETNDSSELPSWTFPILEWYHATQARLLQDRSALLHRRRAVGYGLSRLQRERITLSDHAVDRYMERWPSALDRVDAINELRIIAAGATCVHGDTTYGGLWQNGHIRMIVKGNHVVTVFAPEHVYASYQKLRYGCKL